MSKNWDFKKKDYMEAKKLFEEEIVDPMNKENMFFVGIHCIIYIQENRKKHYLLYDAFVKNNLNTPDEILNNEEKLVDSLKSAIYFDKKKRFIQNYCQWWKTSELPDMILEDVLNGKKREFEFRDIIAEQRIGLSYKSASYFMQKLGYENVAVLDKHEGDFLSDVTSEPKYREYIQKSGIVWRARYVQCENIFKEEAKKRGVSPAVLHFAVWNWNSIWK